MSFLVWGFLLGWFGLLRFLDVLELEIPVFNMVLFQFNVQSRLVRRCKTVFVPYIFLSFILFCICCDYVPLKCSPFHSALVSLQSLYTADSRKC